VSTRARFLIVTFHWKTAPKVVELKPVFDTALDWLRIAPNCWILWTNSETEVWFSALQPYLGTDDSMFIGELNLSAPSENYTGWYAKWVWDWINKHRS